MPSKQVDKPVEEEEVEEVEQQEIDDEIEQEWTPIDKLAESGIQMADITKLKQAGIVSIQGVMMRTVKELIDIKGMSEAKVGKIREKAVEYTGGGFTSGSRLLEKRQKILKITTGSEAFDTLLGGGVETFSLTEAFGEFRTGKTQIAHTLCVTAQLPPSSGGASGRVIYIDTEGTFRPERIVAIAERFGVDANAVLDNISVARVHTSEQQIDALSNAAALMMDSRYSLIVVDSATALFRADYTGRGTLADRQQALGKFLSRLTKCAEEFGCAVYITNQVVADPGANAMFGNLPKPIGGHIMGHASTTRLNLRKGRGEQRMCKIYDSPCLPEAECVFQISEQGIQYHL